MTSTIIIAAVTFFNLLSVLFAVMDDSVALAVIAAITTTISSIVAGLGGYWAYKAKMAALASQRQNALNHVENQTILKSIDSNVNGKMDRLMEERDKALGVAAGGGGDEK